ncbi:MAG: hypothetical protein Tsb004_30720 [Allomuricauda sp.]
MKKMSRKIKLKPLLKNEWVITLTATLVGVFFALYLNDWSNNRALKNNSELAKRNILNELTNNQSEINQAIISHRELKEIFTFLGESLDDNGGLISRPEIIHDFRSKHPAVIQIKDSIRLDSLTYKYSGEINLDLNLSQLSLKTIAWKTFLDTKVSSLYDFDCLMYLETVYNLTEEIKTSNKVLLEYFTGERDQGHNYTKLLKHLDLLIDFEEVGMETIEEKNERLKNCG